MTLVSNCVDGWPEMEGAKECGFARVECRSCRAWRARGGGNRIRGYAKQPYNQFSERLGKARGSNKGFAGFGSQDFLGQREAAPRAQRRASICMVVPATLEREVGTGAAWKESKGMREEEEKGNRKRKKKQRREETLLPRAVETPLLTIGHWKGVFT